jgi:hypothetical protein
MMHIFMKIISKCDAHDAQIIVNTRTAMVTCE